MHLIRFAVSSATCLLAAPGFADLSASDVWADWQGYASAFGLEIVGTETPLPDGLLVENLIIGGSLADDGTLDLSMDSVRFSETDDGAVQIVLPGEIVARSRTALPDGATSTTSVTYTHAGLETRVTGDPATLVYSFNADSLSAISTTRLIRDGVEEPGADIRFSIADVSGTNTVTVGNARALSQTASAASLSYTVDYTNSNTGARAILTGTAEQVTMTGQSTVPILVMPQTDMSALLGLGLSSSGAFRVGPNSVEVNITGPEGPMDARFTSTSGTISTGLSAAGLSYSVVQDDITGDIAGDMMPLPLSFTLDRSSVKLGIPVLAADGAQDFALGFAFDGLALPDALWQVFDPQGGLPRDPAKVALALSGTARLRSDIFAMEDVGPAPAMPLADFETLTLDTLDVSIAGARLTGTGAFSFPENAANPGPSLPVGAADFTLMGANALLDTLVGMGLLTQQDATGARMMMGLMARPGDAPDTLVSRIEIAEGFEIYANGQRIR